MSTNQLRPRDFANLLLNAESGPPRKRARDQQADRAGIQLRRTVLERLTALDPDNEQIETIFLQIVEELGPPSGPTRAITTSILDEWRIVKNDPKLLEHLLSKAVSNTARSASID